MNAQISTSFSHARRSRKRRKVLLVFLFSLMTTVGFPQMIVADFFNSVINTVSQTIQAASKIINSEAFKQATKVVEKLKEVHNGVQQFRRIQETADLIRNSIDMYRKSLNVISNDKHFTAGEIAQFYSTLNNLATQDSKLITDLAAGIKANLVEMNSSDRLQFIIKIHSDAAASANRLKEFVSGIEYLSMQRCRTTNDRLKTMSLYALSRRTNGSSSELIEFDKYVSNDVDLTKVNDQARSDADALSAKQRAWEMDPNNPKAKENAIKNLLSNMPPAPPKDHRDPRNMRYPELLEAWRKEREQDFKILGEDKANFVLAIPPGISENEWGKILLHKLENGQF